MRPERRGRGVRILRGVGIGAVVVLVLLGLARLALDPLVASRTRRALDATPDQRGTFSRVAVSVLHLSYEIRDLKVERRQKGVGWAPFVSARRLEAGLYWSELVRGHLVGAILLERPKLQIWSTADAAKKKAPSEAPEDVGHVLQTFTPFRLDRAEVRDGELLWVNVRVPEHPRLWFHRIDATLENFSTRAALGRGEPTALALSGTMQRSGQVSIFASADPLAKGLTFAATARLKGLRLEELGELLASTTDVAPGGGTLDMSMRFKAVDGWLTGGVRPVLRNADVKQAKPGLGAKIKAALADAALTLLSDRVPGRNAVATTIPLRGDLTRPDTPLWPTVLAVIRNAFVTGLSDSVEGLPPPAAREKPKPQEQARRAGARHGAAGTGGGK